MNSVLNQKTNYLYEVIVINDGSTDDTKEILKNYQLDSRVKVINQENKGHAGARNSGLHKFNGRYVMFVDSDDYLLPDAIENLLCIAYEKNVDIVEGSFFKITDTGLIKEKFIHKVQHTDYINQKDIYGGNSKRIYATHCDAVKRLHGQPWAKVFKANLFEHIQFPDGFLFEDTILGMLIYPRCQNSYVTDSLVYAYRLNNKGITNLIYNTVNHRTIESQWITELLLNEQRNAHMISEITQEIFLKQIAMNYKRVRLLSEEIKRALFVENCEMYREYFSEYNFNADSFRTRELLRFLKEWNIPKGLLVLEYWDYLV